MENDIVNKAREYAINKLNSQIDIIASAYVDGYNKAKGIITTDDMEYIDLGLPSGTKWATRYIGATDEHPEGSRMVYYDAINYKLPTKEQYLELRSLRNAIVDDKVKFYGLNGNVLSIPFSGFINGKDKYSDQLRLWIKGENIEGNDILAGVYFAPYYQNAYSTKTQHLYLGAFLSVLTVL